MLKRPTSRRKSAKSEISLNLIPMLDMLVVMIAFLMFSMNFLDLVTIQTPVPTIEPSTQRERIKKKPLQLTIDIHPEELRISSPFGRIRSEKIPNLPAGAPDVVLLHERLVAIKQKFPSENQVVLMPQAGINYDVIIAVIDSARELEKSDPTLYSEDAQTGEQIAIKELFPQVVFGNLIGSS